jgi:endonuclease YncB( thermonuclease family)
VPSFRHGLRPFEISPHLFFWQRIEQLAAESGGNLEIVPKREKYGRTLARLWAGGKDAAAIMMAEGLAQPNFGGKKPGWCLEPLAALSRTSTK